MINFLLSVIIGVVFGFFIGVIPGLHSNILAAVLFLNNDIYTMIIIFCSLLSSNVFEFLSASYFNVPKEGEVLALDSLKKFLLDGRIMTAFKLISYSSILTYSIVLILGVLLGNIISILSDFLGYYSWIFLIPISILIIIKQKNSFVALLFFVLTGVLGYFTLNLNLNQPFLSLLTGMFGLSNFFNKNSNNFIPQLNDSVVESNFFDIFKICIISVFSSIIMMLVPNMSPSQISFFTNNTCNDEEKVVNISSLNIADSLLSLVSLFFIGKARSGSVEKISNLIVFGLKEYYLLIICGFFSIILSSFFLLFISRKINKNINFFNSFYVKIFVFIFVIFLCFYFDGLIGFIILLISLIIGILSKKFNCRPVNLMGCLIIPTILFFIINFF